MITFIDLAGHERYLKTTIFGMTGHVPDFAMLMVSEHLFNLVLHKYSYKCEQLRPEKNPCLFLENTRTSLRRSFKILSVVVVVEGGGGGVGVAN